MAAKFTPRLAELTYEAALQSFWRKNALKKFLRASHIAETIIATWAGEESKRVFLDRLFEKLQQSDRGKAVIYQIARNLSEQTSFPDLRSWEDSDDKIRDTHKAVAELKAYLNKQEQEIRSEKDREAAKDRALVRTMRNNCDNSVTVDGYNVGIFRPFNANIDPAFNRVCPNETELFSCLGAPHREGCQFPDCAP